MIATEARPVEAPVIEDWTDAPRSKLERVLYRLQRRIYQAQDRGNARSSTVCNAYS